MVRLHSRVTRDKHHRTNKISNKMPEMNLPRVGDGSVTQTYYKNTKPTPHPPPEYVYRVQGTGRTGSAEEH